MGTGMTPMRSMTAKITSALEERPIQDVSRHTTSGVEAEEEGLNTVNVRRTIEKL